MTKKIKYLKKGFLAIAVILIGYIMYHSILLYSDTRILRMPSTSFNQIYQEPLNPTHYIFPISYSVIKDSLILWQNKFRLKFNYALEGHYKVIANARPMMYSYVYEHRHKMKGRDKYARQHFNYFVSVDSIGINKSLVKVQTIGHFIYRENEHIMKPYMSDEIYSAKKRYVESTTIEEYELLRYIGKRLGLIDQMPHVKYPSHLTKREILYIFGSYNPFTYNEMFADSLNYDVVGYKYLGRGIQYTYPLSHDDIDKP